MSMPFQLTYMPEQPKPAYYTLTPRSLTLCLAYIQRHAPAVLPKGRFIAPTHLRTLAGWIGLPRPNLITIRHHPILAGHFALLIAADLLILTDHTFSYSLTLTDWLNHSYHDQVNYLLQALQKQDLWHDVVESLGWTDILSLDMTAYLVQTLLRQIDLPVVTTTPPALWQTDADPDTWRLHLPAESSTRLLFDLLQLGHFQPPLTLQLTPLTIASPPACHLGYDHICWLLETATQSPLTSARRQQLHQWLQRTFAYRVDGPLLSTKHPQQLQNIYKNRRLRPYLLEQISPRHVLIDTGLVPALRRWLARQGYPLNQPPPATNHPSSADDLATSWLGHRLLLGLQKYMRLPIPPPAAQQSHLERQLAPETLANLERLAQTILSQLNTIISGRDAFFPAWQSPSPQLIATIEAAIASGGDLRIGYRGIGQYTVEWHEIEPLRLEKHAALTYLHAFSRRAQANRTFRLDRVTGIA